MDVFLRKTHELKIPMAIGSAAIMYNIDFVLDGLDIRHYFGASVSADNVSYSKLHPETWLQCSALLNISPADCIVFEDSPKGVEAAARSGMQAIVITTMHVKEEFKQFNNVLEYISDYSALQPESL